MIERTDNVLEVRGTNKKYFYPRAKIQTYDVSYDANSFSASYKNETIIFICELKKDSK